MRNYSDYKNQQPDLKFMTLQSARAGDFEYFQLITASEQSQVLNLRDSKGYSPFMLACYHGHRDLVELLLDWGADPNDKDLGGNSVLMGAAFKGHVDVMKLLLAHGADPQQKNNKGQGASLFAQMFGRTEALTLLQPDTKTNLKEKLKAWILFFKPTLRNERTHNV
jgi:ankyrin repeat protein